MRRGIAALAAAALLAGYLLRRQTSLFLFPVMLFDSIFLKNALAAMATAYLGAFFSHLELLIYRRISEEAYSTLDRLTEPLYAVLSKLAAFPSNSPLRACVFYLYFVPSLSLFANLTAVSAYFWSFAPGRAGEFLTSLMPHAVLEAPAMLASIALGFAIATRLRRVAMHGDVEAFEAELRGLLHRRSYLLTSLAILVLLYFAALLESA